jgi:ribonuclease D
MNPITTTVALAEFCRGQTGADFIAVDTEFMRDKTYWPLLCLVQVAGPEQAAAIDPLAPDLDLGPLLTLLADRTLLKVFHAARQDLEIFFHMTGAVPGPLFDTQVAAMVCGFGEAASYETLANKLAGASIDKSSRFTDWSHRPLSERQLRYALADVVPLRTVYDKLAAQLARTGRTAWVEEEMAILRDPATYRLDPRESWRRLKFRGVSRRTLAFGREIAAWRETAAQQRNLPRNRLLRDEAILEIASHPPEDLEGLARIRGLGRSFAEGRLGTEIMAAVARARDLPENEWPEASIRRDVNPGTGPIVELLRVLLKACAEENGVAPRLIADSEDLDLIAASDRAPVHALQGWRLELFGHQALDLKQGRLGLTVAGKTIKRINLKGREEESETVDVRTPPNSALP